MTRLATADLERCRDMIASLSADASKSLLLAKTLLVDGDYNSALCAYAAYERFKANWLVLVSAYNMSLEAR